MTQAALTVSNSDPRSAGPAARNVVERWFAARLRDERDLKFVRVSLAITALVVPGFLVFYALNLPVWAAIFWVPVLFAGFGGRFTLMLHAVCHRPLFKPQHTLLEAWIPWMLGPFFGQTPTSFYVHHIGMHHIENNLAMDQSSTLCYQRDKFTHFLHYWARFFFTGTVHLARYFGVRGRDKMVRKFLVGEFAWYAFVIVMLAVRPGPTLALFVVPWLLIRWFMMCGNWAQHAFIDVDDPGNNYRNSTCLTDVPYNHKAYNDGYHIVHHLKPSMHWTEMPDYFLENIEEFGRQDALVFQGLGNNQAVWWCLMSQNWEKLAQHMVQLPGAPERTLEERVALLQGRVRKAKGAVRPLVMWEQLEEAVPAK